MELALQLQELLAGERGAATSVLAAAAAAAAAAGAALVISAVTRGRGGQGRDRLTPLVYRMQLDFRASPSVIDAQISSVVVVSIEFGF